MKNITILFFLFLGVVLIGCEKTGIEDDTTNPAGLNIVLNNSANVIGQNRAVIGGNITADGGTPIVERGICWHIAPAPTISNNKVQASVGTGSFTATIVGLLNNTTYYARAYATTSTNTFYSSEVSFTTQPLVVVGAGVTDIDGNVYKTVKIADKEWMAENLKTTKYRNGNPIPNITVANAWRDATAGAWCHYNNNTGYERAYGKLYNWFAAADPRQIAPAGWHVPSEGEWRTLASNFGANNVSGGALKQTGTTEWQSPNTYATNISLMTALPGGRRSNINGSYDNQGQNAYFWTADERSVNQAESVFLSFNNGFIYTGSPNKKDGLSIRCVKD
jgi:uncharacterized protein (TIGR02145 family)